MNKVLNTNKIQFLTSKGLRTPKYIWLGQDSKGCIIQSISLKELKAVIARSYRLVY